MAYPSRLHHIFNIITAIGNHNSLKESSFFLQNHRDENMTRYQIATIPLEPGQFSNSLLEGTDAGACISAVEVADYFTSKVSVAANDSASQIF